MMKGEKLDNKRSLMDQLRKEGIVAYDVQCTAEEHSAVESMHIEHEPEHFDYYGSSASELKYSIEQHLQQIGSNAPEILLPIAHFAARIVEEMKVNLQQTSAWVTIRTFLPTTDFDIPRWHSDGHYLKNGQEEFVSEEYKLVFAIKGAPTRFQDFEAKKGEATMYRVGEQGKNVHSEPQITEPRIFMSVITGSSEQIEELQRRFESHQ